MRTKIKFGNGICGMELHLNIGDMFQADMMSKKVKDIIENNKKCKEYDETPESTREEIFPDGCPGFLALSEEDLNKIYILLGKMSQTMSSTLFEEKDEEEKDEENSDSNI